MGGFPLWTLWGMALALIAALLILAFSLVMQSPQRKLQNPMEPYRYEERLRALTTYALALILLGIGFFAAGVPFGAAEDGDEVFEENSAESAAFTLPDAETTDALSNNAAVSQASTLNENPTPTQRPQTPESGAFSGPPPTERPTNTPEPIPTEGALDSVVEESQPLDESTAVESEAVVESDATATATLTPSPVPTETPTPTPSNTPTAIPTATETPTPLPTLTPTPIEDPTAILETGGSTVWVRRSPGGQETVLLKNGDTVIVLAGNANQAGILWKEIATVDGVVGWVQLEFLNFDAAE